MFRGTRVPVQTLLDYLEAGGSIDDFLEGFPSVTLGAGRRLSGGTQGPRHRGGFVRVLLDECLDWRLSRDIVGHDVKTAHRMGWAGIKNGELLALAFGQFDMVVTVDRNLAFQQNLLEHSIAVIVLQAKTNRLADLRPLVPSLLAAVGSAGPGTITRIGAS